MLLLYTNEAFVYVSSFSGRSIRLFIRPYIPRAVWGRATALLPCRAALTSVCRIFLLGDAWLRSPLLLLVPLGCGCLATALSTGPQLLLFYQSLDAPQCWHSHIIYCQACDLLLPYIIFLLRLISFLCISVFLLILHFFYLVPVYYSPSLSIHCFYFNHQITQGVQYPRGFLLPFHLQLGTSSYLLGGVKQPHKGSYSITSFIRASRDLTIILGYTYV